MKILMAAAENDALPKGKVGGIADVVRDIAPALARAGQEVDVVLPSYGYFLHLPNAHYYGNFQVNFAGHTEQIDVYHVDLDDSQQGVKQWVLDHPLFSLGGEGNIYCNDGSDRPFASDASKFALFSVAVAQAILEGVFGQVDVLHLHDWHAAMIALLRAYAPKYHALKQIHTVYTIHNLALQGIRPFEGDDSSLMAWFPDLHVDRSHVCDRHIHHCFNPVRAGINLSDRVHAVSPNYAKEILLPSHPELGFIGGEGLQDDLQNAANEGRLHGILNGCEYPDIKYPAMKIIPLLQLLENETLKLVANNTIADSAHLILLTRLKQLLTKTFVKQPLIVTSIGRITDQKALLFKEIMPDGQSVLTHLLHILASDGLFIMLGSGDPILEAFFTKAAAAHENFIFIKGYSVALPDSIYNSGDLFVMPSSFEPCGISQMLSMRAGQPCLAHSVGGLSDTIEHNVSGFTFTGENPQQQAQNMISAFNAALTLRKKQKAQWNKIVAKAKQSRFLWCDAANAYIEKLYAY